MGGGKVSGERGMISWVLSKFSLFHEGEKDYQTFLHSSPPFSFPLFPTLLFFAALSPLYSSLFLFRFFFFLGFLKSFDVSGTRTFSLFSFSTFSIFFLFLFVVRGGWENKRKGSKEKKRFDGKKKKKEYRQFHFVLFRNNQEGVSGGRSTNLCTLLPPPRDPPPPQFPLCL